MSYKFATQIGNINQWIYKEWNPAHGGWGLPRRGLMDGDRSPITIRAVFSFTEWKGERNNYSIIKREKCNALLFSFISKIVSSRPENLVTVFALLAVCRK